MFNFTHVRGPYNKTLQLAEIELYDANDNLISVSQTISKHTPGAVASQSPDAVVDGTNAKWLDANFNGVTMVGMMTPAGSEINYYKFKTGNDNPERDPVSWKLFKLDLFGNIGEGANFTLLQTVTNLDPPTERNVYYPTFYMTSPPYPPSIPPSAPPSKPPPMTPPLPPSPPPAPPGEVFMFNFSAVRGPANDTLQLAEIELYDANDNLISVTRTVAKTTPGAVTKQSPTAVVDGTDVKWVDAGFTGTSMVGMMVPAGSELSYYKFKTGNDQAPRDPISWKVFKLDLFGNIGEGANFTLLQTVTNYDPPTERNAYYPTFYMSAPPSPPSPPPLPPPSSPPPPASLFEILFTGVKGTGQTTMQIAELKLYNTAGHQINVSGITTNAPFHNKNQMADAAIDGSYTTKFSDASFNGTTILTCFLPAGTEVQTYEVITANDNPDRDPTSWVVTTGTNGGTTAVVSTVSITPPDERGVTTGMVYMQSPPSPPPAPPPIGKNYMFRFTKARDPTSTGIQMSEVKFYSSTGNEINISLILGTGTTAGNEGPDKLIDGDLTTKWYDVNFKKTDGTYLSNVGMHLGTLDIVHSYEIYTANDNENRDPVSWKFGEFSYTKLAETGDGFTQLSEVNDFDAPTARSAPYNLRFIAYTPPSPPNPPAPPPVPPKNLSPPSPPGSTIYQFKFTSVYSAKDNGGARHCVLPTLLASLDPCLSAVEGYILLIRTHFDSCFDSWFSQITMAFRSVLLCSSTTMAIAFPSNHASTRGARTRMPRSRATCFCTSSWTCHTTSSPRQATAWPLPSGTTPISEPKCSRWFG